MATFPTFETTLTHIANALGVSKSIGSTTKKDKFKNNELSLENFSNTWKEILNNIFDAIELAERERRDLIWNIQHDYNIHKQIELNVFTFKASSQKIAWQYLSRVLIPALARHTVFWQIESKIDEGMPGGKFWYLPFLNPIEPNAQIELPMQQTLKWLIDLIEKPKAEFVREIESDLKIFEGTGTIKKNLYNWLEANNTPEVSSIQTTFPDELSIDFHGCFEPNSNQCPFKQSLDFVKRKGQTPSTLHHEISMTESVLIKVYSGNCSNEVKAEFLNKVCERYQRPKTKTIRQRLIIARAIQYGYEELVKFLTPNVDKHCTDLTKNKVMQLVRLYEMTYNLTLRAHIKSKKLGNHPDREKIENNCFTSSLQPLYRTDILLCVASEEHNTVDLVAPRLNEIFYEPSKENALSDIFLDSPKEQFKLNTISFEHHQKRALFNENLDSAMTRLIQNKAPYRLVQSINDFHLAYELAKLDFPSPKITSLLFMRLAELEDTPEKQLKRITLELDMLLSTYNFNKDTENRVSELLELAYTNEETKHWLPFIFKLDAYHHIAQNRLKEAERLLKKAIKECMANSFGSMRGLLARDAFALAVANSKLIPNNHETYFKDILLWGGWKPENDNQSLDIYDLSRQLHEHFWTKQYRHYPNYEPLFSDFKKDFEAFYTDFLTVVKNKEPIKPILKKHNTLKAKQLKSPQSDSIVLLLLKVTYDFLLKSARYKSQLDKSKDVSEIELPWKMQLSALREIILEWPQIVDLSDFKNQTPLMIAVHNRDYETAKALLEAGSNPNLQDIKGRTALHSACASRTLECVKLLIENDIDVKITTIEGATALHTAVRMGETEIAKYLIRKFPHLLSVKELNYRTPLMLAEKIATDPFFHHILVKGLELEQRKSLSHSVYIRQLNELKELDSLYKKAPSN